MWTCALSTWEIINVRKLVTQEWTVSHCFGRAATVATFTSGQRILTNGHIAILSPLAALNGFVRPWPVCMWVSPPNGISTSSAVSTGCMNVPNRQTDRHTHTHTHTHQSRYSICSNSPHLMQCMWCGLIIGEEWNTLLQAENAMLPMRLIVPRCLIRILVH